MQTCQAAKPPGTFCLPNPDTFDTPFGEPDAPPRREGEQWSWDGVWTWDNNPWTDGGEW